MRSIACVAALCLFSLWGYSKSRALRIRAMIMRAFGTDIQRLCREMKHRPRELRSMVLCFEGSELEGFWKLLGRASELASGRRKRGGRPLCGADLTYWEKERGR